MRRRLLIGPDGTWRRELWLDALVAGGADPEAAPETAPATTPEAAPESAVPDGPPGPTAMAPAPGAGSPPGSASSGDRPASGSPAGRARKSALTAPLDINACSADSLQLLPGVGPVLAARLDEARRAGRVFRTPDDLLGIKGIGPAAMARLTPLIRFAAAPGGPAATPPEPPLRADNRH